VIATTLENVFRVSAFEVLPVHALVPAGVSWEVATHEVPVVRILSPGTKTG